MTRFRKRLMAILAAVLAMFTITPNYPFNDWRFYYDPFS
nr:MAG TPA: hypothetical protein [Caudoviricetes sp.]